MTAGRQDPGTDGAGQQLTIAEMLSQRHGKLTPAERKISRLLTPQYPLPGLDTVTRLAARAGVGAPTGYPAGREARLRQLRGLPECVEGGIERAPVLAAGNVRRAQPRRHGRHRGPAAPRHRHPQRRDPRQPDQRAAWGTTRGREPPIRPAPERGHRRRTVQRRACAVPRFSSAGSAPACPTRARRTVRAGRRCWTSAVRGSSIRLHGGRPRTRRRIAFPGRPHVTAPAGAAIGQCDLSTCCSCKMSGLLS